jgi:hypothetical protein
MNKEQLIDNLLKQNHINNYQIQKIAGDASFRHYYRIKQDHKSFIIMDAPPPQEDIEPFCKIADFLLKNNFSAPKIFAKDKNAGLLLLEDFGDTSYRKAMEQKPSDEINLYTNSVDLLINLAQINPPNNLAIHDHQLLLEEVMLFVDWYLPKVALKRISTQQINEFQHIWLGLFSKLSPPKNLVLRDYHSDNLMLLDNKKSIQKVGLLDFQDAIIGYAAYDLVSLLEDARRDVSINIWQKMLKHYLNHSNCDEDQFMIDCQILSLQRNIKIIGIFSRLFARDGKKSYLNFLPRVFGYINKRLQNKHLTPIKNFLEQNII